MELKKIFSFQWFKEWSAKEMFRYSIAKCQNNKFFLLSRYVLLFLCFFLPLYISVLLFSLSYHTSATILAGITILFYFLARCWLLLDILSLVESETKRPENLLDFFLLYLNFLVSALIVLSLVVVGTVLGVVPGVYLYLRLQFYGHAVCDEKKNAIQALFRSFEVTRDEVHGIFHFWLRSRAICALGFLTFIVGLLASFPIVAVAKAFLWRRLRTK